MRMSNRVPSDEWIEAANCLATVAHQLSSAVHEANNLLQVVSGSAEMILMKPSLPADVQKRAETIADHARQVSALLGGLRDLSCFAPPAASCVTDLTIVIESALDLRRHALTRGRVALSLSGLDAPCPAAIDWRSAMQVVLNLLLNAEEAVVGSDDAARASASPAIAIAVASSDGFTTVAVTDNGPGPTPLASVALRRQPYAPPHLGIGLATARTIADRCGGELRQEMSPAGTVTTLRIPTADGMISPSPRPAA